MNTSLHEVPSFLHDPETLNLDRLYGDCFFKVNQGDQYLIDSYARELRELCDQEIQSEVIDSSKASEQYRELSTWNREKHNRLIEKLEIPYVELSKRISEYAINNQYQLERASRQVPLIEIPYAIASLPPNLFDHLGSEPFIPDTDDEIMQLVSEFMLFNRRLNKQGMPTVGSFDHSFMGRVVSQGFDTVLELQRRRDNKDQTFATESGRQSWYQYNREFRRRLLEGQHGASLSRNATYVAYRKNRQFSEAGGFFEFVDDRFDSFWLADFGNGGTFTSQIRSPVGWYGSQAAKELALGTHMMMNLIMQDARFAQDIKQIAHDPETRELCQDHLLRSSDCYTGRMDPVEYGILQTALEGVQSVSATFGGIIEADGIPGYEMDLWTGLPVVLDQQIISQTTAKMPAGLVVAQTMWGYRISNPLITNGQRIRTRPQVAATYRQIEEKRIAMQHATWLEHNQSGKGKPPVRFGLFCPFKGPVVQKMSETLMICRAIAHG